MHNIKSYASFVNEAWGIDYIKDKLKAIADVGKNIPLHIRACLKFMRLSSDAMTEEFLSDEESSMLYNIIYYTRTLKPNATKVSYPDFAAYQKYIDENENMQSQVDTKASTDDKFNTFTASSIVNRLSLTLGNCTVSKTGSSYKVTDIYDFNCIQNFPEQYEWKNFPSTLANSISKLFGGQAVKGAEGILSWYQKFGYEGYPVAITLNRPANFVAPVINKNSKTAKTDTGKMQSFFTKNGIGPKTKEQPAVAKKGVPLKSKQQQVVAKNQQKPKTNLRKV